MAVLGKSASGFLVFVACGALAASIVGREACAQAPAPGEAPPPAVVVQRIEVQDVSAPERFSARVEAIEAVDIRARVQGFLQSVAFEAGQRVNAGDLLFEIEPAQYEAAVASARAQVSRAEATRTQTERQLARTQELRQRDVAAQVALDEAKAASDIAVAEVEAAQAALRNAELKLSYTRITAPIAGEIGRAAVTQGNLVGPEAGVLARIVQLDPIRVVFSVTEATIVTLRQGEKNGNAIDPSALRLTLRLPNNTDYPHPGKIEYEESEVNPQTGTVAVRLIFPNPDGILIPNQFVTLITQPEVAPRLPVVPQTAVLQDREGRYVYVLGENNTVSQRRIETGAQVKNGWAVTKGLSGGEVVVVEGIQRLGEGMVVQPTQPQSAEQGT